jgi:transposase
MDISAPIRRRRKHDPEFKHQLVGLCRPGVSTSAVALAHGVNANLLRRWIKQDTREASLQTVPAPAKLVAIQVDMPADTPVDDAIEITIQNSRARISIRWPGNRAEACGQWLAAWVK